MSIALLSSRLLLLLACSIAFVHPLAPPQKHAVVVGAGPVGIAAALTLASHHNYTVTLLESSPAASVQSEYDPTKAFLYNVNGRGQVFTKQFPNMQQKMADRSVPSAGMSDTTITIVPADPAEEIPEKKKKLEKDKEKKTGMQNEKITGVGFWLPRHELVKLMAECIDEHNVQSCHKITLLTGQECAGLEPTDKAGQSNDEVHVTARNVENGKLKIFPATLVVGADGMNSKVRQSLANASKTLWHKGFKPHKFQLKKWTSPASHLRIKVLQLPPRFEIPNANDKPALKTTSEDIYALRSVNTGPTNYLSLGLLPMKDNNAVRPTNIVTRPDHEVWTINDGPSMKSYFQKAYPRFDFDKLISDGEWDRFAKAQGTRFPHCQRTEGLAAWDKSTGTCGVALVGDACHAFPPDIGQGVNAGLMDVVALDRALGGLEKIEKPTEATNKEPISSLQTKLERYQKQHARETASLVRLARFGAPYQYKQPHRADRALRTLWTVNVAFRLILSKLTFGLVQPSCIILSQNTDLTFRQVMRRADLTTAFFQTLLLGGALWAKRGFVFGFLKTLRGV